MSDYVNMFLGLFGDCFSVLGSFVLPGLGVSVLFFLAGIFVVYVLIRAFLPKG